MTVSLESTVQYRSRLAREALTLWRADYKDKARDALDENERGVPYAVAKKLRRNRSHLVMPSPGEVPYQPEPTGSEEKEFGFHTSNEHYVGLGKVVGNIGGVGLTVGSDQCFDFRTMGKLEEVDNVDIDPKTHLVTRAYMEVGARMRKLMGKFPAVADFISMFDALHWGITVDMLSLPSTRYSFSPESISWLRGLQPLGEYLRNKKNTFQEQSWVGTDANLSDTISSYEQGNVRISRGNVFGSVLPVIAENLKRRKKTVSVIYTSNVARNSVAYPLEKFRLLPTTRDTVVVYTEDLKNPQIEYTRRPNDFSGVWDWSHFIFRLHEHDRWPDVYHADPMVSVDEGVYFFGNPNERARSPQFSDS